MSRCFAGRDIDSLKLGQTGSSPRNWGAAANMPVCPPISAPLVLSHEHSIGGGVYRTTLIALFLHALPSVPFPCSWRENDRLSQIASPITIPRSFTLPTPPTPPVPLRASCSAVAGLPTKRGTPDPSTPAAAPPAGAARPHGHGAERDSLAATTGFASVGAR